MIERMAHAGIVFMTTVLLVYLLAVFIGGPPVTTGDVYQYVDHDAQVVCYILENGNGISCLPLDEIRQAGE